MSLDVYLTKDIKENNCNCCWQVIEKEVFWQNITHNLNTMADKAWIYEALWRPEEIWAKKAKDIIEILVKWVARLEWNPKKYKKLNPKNWWGDYDWLLQFVKKYLNACIENPDSIIEISR